MIQTCYKITYTCSNDATSKPATVCLTNDGKEPCVHVVDPWGNEAVIPLSIYSQVEACMQEVVNEHMGRAKE